jgi:tRNA nucleotidyltransferase (CCA-adding enzyme)
MYGLFTVIKGGIIYSLSQYVSNVLRPTSDQDSFISSKLESIENVIKNNKTFSLKKVIHGGSYEKGTMLKNKPDVDLVLVFNKEPDTDRNWKTLMEKVYHSLKAAFPNEDIKPGENIAVHLKFKQNKAINFDIVPSYDVNSPSQMASVKNISR